MANKVLFATDFSPISEQAFEQAVKFAKLTGSGLVVAHVLHFPPMVGSAFVPMAEETEEAMRTWCRNRLGELAAKATAGGVAAETALREEPYAHAGIIKAADEHKALMIVLGTHGRTGLSKLVLGSVAARVITESPCPVLTVRAR
jgi:nucleotide-binding universal stress UspA family protein